MNGESFLDLLSLRRSVRAFTAQPVPRAVLERLMQAAVTAPSPTNRQPWRFAVVTKSTLRQRITEAVRLRAEEMKAIIRQGHHAEDFGQYGDFFHEPLSTATAIIVPQYRVYPDLIANLVASGGGDPTKFHTAASMQAELCSTSAACMALLLQAQAEGLGACWMSGPMIARDEIQRLLDIREPWKMVGAMAVGYPEQLPTKPSRKPLAQVVTWFEDDAEPREAQS
ncbi:nitroreductase family protein [Hyalangium gracile]|uniref:nitroreductase family protein n=1 Tax=Hyalangium gracile TaxID=394092 RepID=UPI001CCF184A|nr:nitroreductase family protein [Hyalangium gracile]